MIASDILPWSSDTISSTSLDDDDVAGAARWANTGLTRRRRAKTGSIRRNMKSPRVQMNGEPQYCGYRSQQTVPRVGPVTQDKSPALWFDPGTCRTAWVDIASSAHDLPTASCRVR